MGFSAQKSVRARAAFEAFAREDLNESSTQVSARVSALHAVELFHRVRRTVPAYAAFLRDNEVDGDAVHGPDEFARVPATTKENYHRRHDLTDLCRDGRLTDCDMVAVSSGSTGEPSFWPRFVTDELATAARFEQVLRDAFDASSRSTLCVICFSLGSWVGGMYTASCCRHLAAKGYPLTLVTPGNQKGEILRVLRSLAPAFDQLVLFGYPPFLKDVIDAGHAEGFGWARHRVRLVMAGEVFSEAWRTFVCERIGAQDPAYASASLYGTADGGVLANETPWSIRVRRALDGNPRAARELFGEARLPTLCQYDPVRRFFEVESEDSLLFTADGGIPLIRYKILDRGGLVSYETMNEFLNDHGICPPKPALVRELPFVFVFGRSSFALSFYGANVYPENVAAGIEARAFSELLTGKFVMEISYDEAQNPKLCIAVELCAKIDGSPRLAADVALSIRHALEKMNSEFLNYAPDLRRTPSVELYPQGSPDYFPVGVKHRYTRT